MTYQYCSLSFQVKPLPASFQDAMIKNISGHKIKVEVMAIGFGIANDRKSLKVENTKTLHNILSTVGGALTFADDEAELMGMFVPKSVSSAVIYKGPLCIGGNLLSMNVRVYKKIGTERIPTMKPYSER